MSSNRPSDSTPKSDRPGASKQPPPRPAGSPGPRPAGAGGPRPAGGAPRRPLPPGTKVQVRPTRPQAGPPPAAASRYTPFLIGGALILVAVILIGSILLNNSGTGSTSGGAACTGPADPNGSTACVTTSKGVFKIHLFTDDPSVKGTIKNFRDKVNSGYFDGKVFHRVEGFVIQGGDPTGTGSGGGNIPGEYNQRAFNRGAVGMASTSGHAAQVNDSQWFVVKTDTPSLNGLYDNFGQVSDGLDVVDKIAIGDKMTKLVMQP